MDERLQKICDAYDEAGREQPSEYPALPAWETLSIEMREAIVHIYYRGRFDALSSDAAHVSGMGQDRDRGDCVRLSGRALRPVPAGADRSQRIAARGAIAPTPDCLKFDGRGPLTPCQK
jgi:hypothetical protein